MKKTIRKDELRDYIAIKTGHYKKVVDEILKAERELIIDQVKQGNEVSLKNFGVFKQKSSRIPKVNNITGKPIDSDRDSKKKLGFDPAKCNKDL